MTDRAADRHLRPPVAVRFPADLYDQIEATRGSMTRNAFIVQAVALALASRPAGQPGELDQPPLTFRMVKLIEATGDDGRIIYLARDQVVSITAEQADNDAMIYLQTSAGPGGFVGLRIDPKHQGHADGGVGETLHRWLTFHGFSTGVRCLSWPQHTVYGEPTTEVTFVPDELGRKATRWTPAKTS